MIALGADSPPAALAPGHDGTEEAPGPPPTPFANLIAAALDQSDDVVLVVDRAEDGTLRIVAVNGAFCRMSFYAPQDVLGRPFAMLASPGHDLTVMAKITATAAARSSLRTELLCRSARGAEFWFGLHLMAADDPSVSGAPVPSPYLVVLGRDITEPMRARDQQNAMQQLLANVFVSVDAAVAIVAADGRFLMTNPGMDRLLGFAPAALMGTRTMDRLGEAWRDLVARARAQQMQDERSFAMDLEVLRQDGTAIPVHLTAVMIKGRDQQRFRIVTIREATAPQATTRVQVAGKVKLVGLEEVKASLGDHWDEVAERVLQCAEIVIKRHLDKRDTFSRTADQGFVICFASLSEQEASFQAAMIAREIRKRLIGQGEDPTASQVTAITASVVVPAGQVITAASLATLVEDRLRASLADIQAEARRTLQNALGHLQCELEAIYGRADNDTIARYACLPRLLENRLQAALSSLPSDEAAGFDIDVVLLQLAAEYAARAALDGFNGPLLVELGFETFVNRPKTERYLAALQRLDTRLRQRLIVILAHLPAGLARARLQDCVQRLRPLCRGIGFEIEELTLPPIDFVFSGPPILVISARTRRAERLFPSGPVARLVDPLHAFRGRLLVRHVPSHAAASQLRRMGIDMVSFIAESTGVGNST